MPRIPPRARWGCSSPDRTPAASWHRRWTLSGTGSAPTPSSAPRSSRRADSGSDRDRDSAERLTQGLTISTGFSEFADSPPPEPPGTGYPLGEVQGEGLGGGC